MAAMKPLLCFALWCWCSVASAMTSLNSQDHALVTLVTGDGGYVNGALALGSSYLGTSGNMSLVALVTPEVPVDHVKLLATMWKVIEVDPVACNHKLGSTVSAATHDLEGEGYKAGLARWKHTCTKFRAWQLTQFKRVVFMDSDMLVISSIDHALFDFSNASFAAAPETFPPDTFNAGFMVLTPSEKMFKKLLQINNKIGSAEGGDQGVLNYGLCPHWFTADKDDPDCGRLPWIFNVEVAHYKQYETLQKMASRPLPAVVHFVSDGKPWTVLAMDYLEERPPALLGIKDKLGALAYAHALWRLHFFKATRYTPPSNSIFGEEMDSLFSSNKQKYIQQRKPNTLPHNEVNLHVSEKGDESVNLNNEKSIHNRNAGIERQQLYDEQEKRRAHKQWEGNEAAKRGRGPGKKRLQGKVLRKRKTSRATIIDEL